MSTVPRPTLRPVEDLPGQLTEAIRRLEAYCRLHRWAGFDPYDALNSELFARTPLARSRIARLAFTQFLKRSPVNLRPLLHIRPRQDPKALALFLMSYVRRAEGGDGTSRGIAGHLASRLLELRSPRVSCWCWGYSFPWQTRHRLVPRFSPNLVCTAFAANALLDAYQRGLGDELLGPAASAGEYIANELFWKDGRSAGFAYPLPGIRVPVHNASFLGAALLCRLARLTGGRAHLDAAMAAARHSARSQRQDGSWPYGAASTQQWVDNFHTGFNLCALRSIRNDLHTGEFDSVLSKGFRFYREHFFTPDGAPRYFHDRTYPIDIHCVAQSVITLADFSAFESGCRSAAQAVLSWAMRRMWDPRGFFHYRVLRGITIGTPFMRWSQAWMLLALLAFCETGEQAAVAGPTSGRPPRSESSP